MTMLTKSVFDILKGATDPKGRQFGTDGAIGWTVQELQNVLARSRLFLYGAGIMCMSLFFVYLYLIVIHQQDTTKLAAFSSVFGVSLAAVITTMMRMARSQVQSGMLLALVSELPQDEVLPAMKALLDHELKMNPSKT